MIWGYEGTKRLRTPAIQHLHITNKEYIIEKTVNVKHLHLPIDNQDEF
jgi:hypothetical protein